MDRGRPRNTRVRVRITMPMHAVRVPFMTRLNHLGETESSCRAISGAARCICNLRWKIPDILVELAGNCNSADEASQMPPYVNCN